MKPINRRVHGILDYGVGIVLMLAPKIFGFEYGGIESRIPVYLGIATIVYSLVTRYELGIFKLLPFRGHLTLDVCSGLLLASSPWIFGFAEQVWVPHLVFGLLELGVVAMTRTADETVPAAISTS